MDDGSRLFFGLLLVILFLSIKGFFTACEKAVIEVNDTKIKRQAETDIKSRNLLNIISQPNKLLTSLSVFKELTTVVVAIIVAVTLYAPLKEKLNFFEISQTATSVIAILIIVLITTLVLVVFGDSIPKKLAMKNTEVFALNVSGTLKWLMIALSPLTKLIAIFTFIFGKLLGFSVNSSPDAVTEEEILMMVDAVNETGIIEESQKNMINNIFEFDDLEVSDVMTHRTDLIAVEKNTEIRELASLAVSEGFSRIPIFENSIDNIIGVVYVKDLLTLIGQNDCTERSTAEFVRDIMYVPQTNHCGELLKEFTSIKVQIAVVVDEYGGTAGIVTMEDLLEAIVGNIQDEYDDEVEDIIKISDTEYEVSGTADPDLVLEEMGLSLPDEHNYDTIGGFVIDLLGHIPDENECPSVDFENITLTVLSTEEKRIVKLKVTLNTTDEILK